MSWSQKDAFGVQSRHELVGVIAQKFSVYFVNV